MNCTSPRTVGFLADGKTISWSPRKHNKEYPTFQLPCGKCISCRLEYSRSWAIRCMHEAQMHKTNSFITLTYSDEKLLSPTLQYTDFQLFIKRLRKKIFTDFISEFGKENWKLLSKKERKEIYAKHQIGYFVTGEYGDTTKRPHWHAIIFNWRPKDSEYYRTTDRGDKIYRSSLLDSLWSHNDSERRPNEIGEVTYLTAGYCARYAAKKLVHGRDGEHTFEPISKKSNHQAIGRSWLNHYYKDIFNQGFVVVDEQKLPIPRYYQKWLQKNHPEEYAIYVTKTKNQIITKASEKSELEKITERQTNDLRAAKYGHQYTPQITRIKARAKIIKERLNTLTKHNKL